MMTDETLDLVLRMEARAISLLKLKAQLPEGDEAHADIDNIVGRMMQHINRVRAVGLRAIAVAVGS
jgi:hypothetical protein